AIIYTETPQTEAETAHRGILQSYSDAIRLGTPLLAPGVEGINELTLSNAAYLSAWKGGWVDLPLDTAAFDEEMARRVEGSRYQPQMVVPEPTDGEYKTRWSVQW
ncbi:MAG: hypothetical protein IJ412_10520, partial [Oscillospiraceae bacterium]|nr:hypothetical protein [Oscillospiraceae bacterium]